MVSETRETARAEGRFGGIRPDVVAGIKKEMAEGRNLRAAVNQHVAMPDTSVKDGDEVAFFPPVTGG